MHTTDRHVWSLTKEERGEIERMCRFCFVSLCDLG